MAHDLDMVYTSTMLRASTCSSLAALLLLLGCEDPPLPTPAGAFFVDFRDTGSSCSLLTHETGVGVIGNSGTPEMIADGAADTTVTCSVLSVGGGFDVNAKIDEKPFLQVKVSGISSSNDSEANAIEGQLSYASVDTGGELYSANNCLFWFNSEDQGAVGGQAWMTFKCAGVESEGKVCEIFQGFVSVENCDGAVTEEE